MPKYVMVVPSSAKDGRDDDYNAWYDGTHMRDICSLPGVKSGRRYTAAQPTPNDHPGKYLAIYEIETDDLGSVLGAMGQKAEAGEFKLSDALDPTSAQIWMYEEY